MVKPNPSINGTEHLSTYMSPLGELTVVHDSECIFICEFSDKQERITRQLSRCHKGQAIKNASLPETLRKPFDAYFKGDAKALDRLNTAPKGTAFQERVWSYLRTIPAGSTLSYGEMAKALGSAPRAVGQANGRNPVALIQPCHRVIGADGTLTGYAGGIDRKAWLLNMEQNGQ